MKRMKAPTHYKIIWDDFVPNSPFLTILLGKVLIILMVLQTFLADFPVV